MSTLHDSCTEFYLHNIPNELRISNLRSEFFHSRVLLLCKVFSQLRNIGKLPLDMWMWHLDPDSHWRLRMFYHHLSSSEQRLCKSHFDTYRPFSNDILLPIPRDHFDSRYQHNVIVFLKKIIETDCFMFLTTMKIFNRAYIELD